MASSEASMSNGAAHASATPRIIDIRSDTAGINLKQEITACLNGKDGGEKTLPTLLLYDDKGLKLFERITYLDQYYLTGAEIEVLTEHADKMADRIPNGALVVELGSGNLRKVRILLDALEKAQKDVTYFALDLMHEELVRTLADVPVGSFQHVKCAGLHGTYDDGLEWLKRPENVARPKAILSLGSSIGNFPREDASEFMAQFATALGRDDLLLVGLDGCLDSKKVFHAYNDRNGVTHDFTINGLQHANRLLGYEAFEMDKWYAIGEYDSVGERHRAFVAPKIDVMVEGVLVQQGEKIRIEESYKYSQESARKLWARAGVIESSSWSMIDAGTTGSYKIHLLTPPTMKFETMPEKYASHPVPGLAEWDELWKTWDLVTRQMIAEDEMMEKPIKLRNACVFYLGHIPTFLDMKLTEATETKPTDPHYFYKIFERGIDPDVDNPEQCHAHSEIPDTWPALDTILQYQKDVRERVRKFYESGQAYNDDWTGRTLWLGFEHEVMHLETLLYMLVQSEKTIPPNNTSRPDFEQLAAQARKDAVDNEWFDVPQQTFQVGLEDPDHADGPSRYFGWDVEKPAYKTTVKAFKAKGRPITNGEYVKYLNSTGTNQIPASWIDLKATNGVNGANGHHTNGDHTHEFIHGKAVRTVFGFVPLKHALDWPVSASYDDLLGCAKYMGGRIPTKEEARSIYHYADMFKKKEAAKALGKTIPAVNGHLVNEGVEETPPSEASVHTSSGAAASLDPNPLFANLDGANVGFKHWHPMPVTQNGNKLSGLAEMGGLWEWTSSTLEKVKGFEPMKLYPAYSVDFYDDKHNIVLGGSWATHPRVAGRKTFVNWYQRNYPYVWAGARLVKDA